MTQSTERSGTTSVLVSLLIGVSSGVMAAVIFLRMSTPPGVFERLELSGQTRGEEDHRGVVGVEVYLANPDRSRRDNGQRTLDRRLVEAQSVEWSGAGRIEVVAEFGENVPLHRMSDLVMHLAYASGAACTLEVDAVTLHAPESGSIDVYTRDSSFSLSSIPGDDNARWADLELIAASDWRIDPTSMK